MLQLVQKNLSNGRRFELEIFGFTDQENAGISVLPEFKDFQSSMQAVVENNWLMYAEALERSEKYYHDPLDPKTGKTQEIYNSVQSFLTKRVRGRDTFPLNLYHSLNGRTSLDWYYGVDAFFWWEGVFVTVDLSLQSKAKVETGRLHLKADFLLCPEDFRPERLRGFGRCVAKLLKRRKNLQERAESKNQNREKFATPIEPIIQRVLEECQNKDLNYLD